MNEYRYHEIAVGFSCKFKKAITLTMLEQFRQITGDCNPLHCSKEYAVTMGFQDRVVYGMLTSAFYSTLAGMYVPGKYCLIHSVETKLLKPVYVGDELTIEGFVKEKNDAFAQLVIKASISNQNGVKVSKAVIKAGVLNG